VCDICTDGSVPTFMRRRERELRSNGTGEARRSNSAARPAVESRLSLEKQLNSAAAKRAPQERRRQFEKAPPCSGGNGSTLLSE